MIIITDEYRNLRHFLLDLPDSETSSSAETLRLMSARASRTQPEPGCRRGGGPSRPDTDTDTDTDGEENVR